jgi:hypothetical protein
MDERLLKIHTLIGIMKDAEAELEVTMDETKERRPLSCYPAEVRARESFQWVTEPCLVPSPPVAYRLHSNRIISFNRDIGRQVGLGRF